MRPFPPRAVRYVGEADRAAALNLCARDPLANCYVAARIGEVDLDRSRSLLGHYPGGRLESLCWVTANVIPVECDPDAAAAFAERLRRVQHQFSSIFGPALQVALLWDDLCSSWRRPLDVRARQPLLAIGPDDEVGGTPDRRVRPADAAELDGLVPAASAMFTEEIGYPPYTDRGSEIAYRNGVRGLIARRRAYILVEDGRILFKADLGSVGVGAGQIQGVWVDPAYRGRGIAAPAMARVVELAREEIDWVSLYVNDYNTQALRTYRRVGFHDVGLFATILF